MIPGNKANKGDVYLHSTLMQSDMKNAPAVMSGNLTVGFQTGRNQMYDSHALYYGFTIAVTHSC